jgi:hypothetical protein
VRFHYTLTPIYELPFGKGMKFFNHAGHGMELLVGGWEFTGIYNFQSGNPLVLPTNSAFYRGDPSPHNNLTKGKFGTYIDPTAFIPYPSKTTPLSVIQAYPTWTGVTSLPGYNYVPTAADIKANLDNGIYNDFVLRNTLYAQTYGDIRNPPLNTATAGFRKNFNFTEAIRLQLRVDATNLFNHPRWGNISTDPTSAFFGRPSGSATPIPVNDPRRIEIAGKIYF